MSTNTHAVRCAFSERIIGGPGLMRMRLPSCSRNSSPSGTCAPVGVLTSTRSSEGMSSRSSRA